MVKAYTELEREGVIAMRHGKGAFVSAEASVLGVKDEFLINHADGTEINEKDRKFLSDLFNQKLTF